MDNNHNVTEFHKLKKPHNKLLKQGTQQLLAQSYRSRGSILAQ
ncbi:hypothetical protein [Candidatus Enterovibrio escicola]|uniref:Uncharacterized protein n=1 Tax=Candidatus Enterovibrio escicola TaxID=1927127 RepID=A0A2A5T1L9_9GAMM|nr:hypothetical protein [Candidatus Enterovibrio escacola]PCS22057.1 hypothetical protein BTN49_2322 [Candidatus Enterovibrio escacola]